MDFAHQSGDYEHALSANVIGKRSAANLKYTNGHLLKLYHFNAKSPHFNAFAYFWNLTNKSEKQLIAFLFALKSDDLLRQSIEEIQAVEVGKPISPKNIAEGIISRLPNRYSAKTVRSASQNLLSSWKQAGFVLGKVKCRRAKPEITRNVVAFAALLAFLDDLRGNFILQSPYFKALNLPEGELRRLLAEAAQYDLLTYQSAGNITSIHFPHLGGILHSNGIQN